MSENHPFRLADISNALITSRDLAELEILLVAAQDAVTRARQRIAETRGPLDTVEKEVLVCRRKKRAALDSLAVTENAARRLGKAATAESSRSKFRGVADVETEKIRSLIKSAECICSEYWAAVDDYRNIRDQETEIHLAISAACLGNAARPNADPGLEPKADAAKERAEVIRKAAKTEDEAFAKERTLPNDEHYDPQYDEHELLLRRARPWV